MEGNIRVVPGEGEGAGRKPINLIVGWWGRFLFFVVPPQFSQVVGEWLENQNLIPDWAYFYCPGAALTNFHMTVVSGEKIKV